MFKYMDKEIIEIKHKKKIQNLTILTHLAYITNAKKRVISTNNVTVLEAWGKHTLADLICYCNMMSAMALNGVRLFLH